MRALLIAVMVLGLAAPVAWGVDPLSPPGVLTPAWQRWYDALLAMRLAECPRERSTTFHFAADGDDAMGDGSIASPFQSLAKAQQILDAHPQGDVALLFRRGDVWRMPASATQSTSALVANAPNVTIADYGTGDKPVLTAFRTIDPASWQPAPGNPSLFVTAAAVDTTWVKDALAPFEPFVQTFSTIECAANERSFFYDQPSGLLYVNPPTSDPDPRTGSIAYEATRPTASGVRLRGDGSRVENIVAFGFGMWFTTPSQVHGIDLFVTGDRRAVAVGCESYYGSSHLMVHAASGTSGGIATFVSCVAGFATPNIPGGETIFNAFSQTGGHQIIWDRCEARFGRLPSTRWSWESTSASRSFFSHGGTGNADADLVIAYECLAPGGPWGPGLTSAFNTLPSASAVEQARGFNIRETHINARTTSMTVAQGGVVSLGGRYLGLRPPVGDPVFTTGAPGGFAIACTFQIDLTGRPPGTFAMYNPGSTQQAAATIVHCHFDVTTPAGVEFRIDFDNPNRSFFATFQNNLFVHRGAGAAVPFRGVVFPRMGGNAYFGAAAPAFTADPTGLVLTSEPPLGGRPSAAGPLFLAIAGGGPAIPLVDGLGFPGPRATIGPLESLEPDLNGDGLIDVEDYHRFLAQPFDLDGSGAVDDADADLMLRRVRAGERLQKVDPARTPWTTLDPRE